VGPAPDIQTRTVDMHVQRLRAKLGVAGDLIETVRGFGYRLRAPRDARRDPCPPTPRWLADRRLDSGRPVV